MISKVVTSLSVISVASAHRELQENKVPEFLTQEFTVLEAQQKLDSDLKPDSSKIEDNDFSLYGNYRTITDAKGDNYFRLQ